MDIKVNGGTLPQKEIDAYIAYVKDKYKHRSLTGLTININGEFVNIEAQFADVPFDRTRRITGYLVGSLDRFNDAKRAEVEDRVKHGTAM